jgi:gluconate:H+ symporter, GntP family
MKEIVFIIPALMVSIVWIVLSIRLWRLPPFFGLLVAALIYGVIVALPLTIILDSMQSGFGTLLQQIGIIVALGAVLGNLLEKTGGMEVISRSLLRTLGKSRPVFAMACIGTVVGIPVFCDSGFIILSRMVPSLVAQTNAAGGSLSLALSSGLYTSHTLIPPTPGPFAAASNLGAANSIGLIIILGVAVSIPVLLVSYLYSNYAGRRIATTFEKPVDTGTTPTEISPMKAWMPLLVPLILIAAGSMARFAGLPGSIMRVVTFVGSPVIALAIGTCLALLLLQKAHRDWPQWMTTALKEAGLILLITGAGGSFGAVIKASNVEAVLRDVTSGEGLNGPMLLISAWVLAALLKTAQGSTTSAMVITSSLIASFATGLASSTLALVVLAIGGGAMCVSHANDSYFWVVSQFGGISPVDTLKRFPLLTFLQGVTVLAMVLLLSFLV